MFSIYILLPVLIFPIAVRSKDGAVRIHGRLLCNGVPMTNKQVNIYESNDVLQDGLWSTEHTNSAGFFAILGSGSEWLWFNPAPYLYIEHYCNVEAGCYKIFRLHVPEMYVTPGRLPEMVMNIGDFDLGSDYHNTQYGIDHTWDFFFGGTSRCNVKLSRTLDS